MMATNPLKPSAFVDYRQTAQRFIEHSMLRNDDYVEKNLAELHIYMESSEIMV